jgi:hypothetical protein
MGVTGMIMKKASLIEPGPFREKTPLSTRLLLCICRNFIASNMPFAANWMNEFSLYNLLMLRMINYIKK